MYKLKILLMTIILAFSIVFTLLTIESVEINGEQFTFCRNIEFWCHPRFVNEQIVYDSQENKYSIEYIDVIEGPIDVENGSFKTLEGEQILIDLPDGQYQNQSGFYDYDIDSDTSTIKVLDENTKVIGYKL